MDGLRTGTRVFFAVFTFVIRVAARFLTADCTLTAASGYGAGTPSFA